MKLLKFNNLSKLEFISHGVSTRQGGVSKNTFNSLNLSFKVTDLETDVMQNRAFLAAEFILPPDRLFFPDQCHSTNIKVVTSIVEQSDLYETDALLCSEKGIGIGVLAADCVPVLFCDAKKCIIAAAHAGWRGTAGLIGPKVVGKMIAEFSCNPEDIIVGIGPAISQKNYEIGMDVAEEILKHIPDAQKFLTKSKSKDRFRLDLQQLNRHILEKSGIPEVNIEIMDICTYANPQLFFSARRDGFACGRFGSVIRLL